MSPVLAAGLMGIGPMELMIVGSEVRRSLVLVVHDSTQQKSIPSDWKSTGRCLQ